MLLALLTFACDLAPKSCNLMYAPDTVEVTIENADLASGAEAVYTFEGDGVTIRCTLSPGEDRGVCDDDSSSLLVEGDLIVSYLWETAPETLNLSLSEDGAELGAWTVSPAYTEDEPNGEGCGFRSYGEASFDLSE